MNDYSIKLIYIGEHRIGTVKGDIFYKTVQGSKHFLRQPFTALAFDLKTLDLAEKAGAQMIVVTDSETGNKYRVDLATIRRAGFPVDRGYGHQLALSLERFEVIQAEGESDIQLSLFGGLKP